MTKPAIQYIFYNFKQSSTHLWDKIEEKWYFAIVDIIEILEESTRPREYWYRLKKRARESGIELSTNCRQLNIKAKEDKGFTENKYAAKISGKIAANARKELEKESGENIVSSENYLQEKKVFKVKKRKKHKTPI